jgi:SAM-dependent methyltransferase
LVYITQPNIPVFRFAPSATDIHDSVWPTHLHFFSPISLVRMAAAAGLNVELLFSVTDPDVAWERYGASVDLDYAGERLSAVARTGDARRGELNNFPYYLGFNSAIYLRNGTELSSQETGTKAPLQQHLADTRRKLDGMRTMVQLLRKAACEVTAYQGGTASSPAEPESKPEPQVGHMQTEHTQAEMQKIADMTVDSLALAIRSGQLVQSPTLTIRTEHPVAFHSADHVHPRGSANDNTRHPRFVVACERYFAKPMMHLDLGCAGGGLVWDFLMAGHHSYGIEGSDYSRLNRRDFWRVIPEHLFTADITQPFALLDTARTHQMFHVITAWEVLEHLSEESLPRFCRNIRDCLRPDGMFFASVATFPDEDPATGAVWHVTVQPREWWLAKFAEHGLHEAGVEFDVLDFVRGSGNPRARDWDVRRNPEMGFHVVLRRSA